MTKPVQPGEILLGKYVVERVLGQGGMGVVVAARHLDLGELFAVKFLLPEAMEDPGAEDRFLREARAAARLKGEHVAKVHDVGRLATGAPYMVMEHLAGTDLKQLLKARGPLPAEEAALLILQACDALAEAHAAGIVHRDLKPANLFLIRRPNGTPCVKVLDFGISKQATYGDADLTKSGMILGSPLYMSPEQIKNTRSADARSDIWSLGVVLYELTTAVKPFDADSILGVIERVMRDEPPPPSQVRAGLPIWVDLVVGRCLAKRPEARFRDIEEMAAVLRDIVEVRRSSASLVPPAGRSENGELGSPPEATTLRVSQPGAPHARASQPDSGPQPSVPGAAGTRISVTSSAWGRTGARGRVSWNGGRTGRVAATIGLVGALGVGIPWLALRKPSGASQPIAASSVATESTPIAAVIPTVSESATAVPVVPEVSAVPAEPTATAAPTVAPTPTVLVGKSPMQFSTSKPKGDVYGDEPPAPRFAPPSTAAPSAQATPTATAAPAETKKPSRSLY